MTGEDKLDQSEITRYARHIVLPEIGGAGQQRLKAARVLVIGAGGAGVEVERGRPSVNPLARRWPYQGRTLARGGGSKWRDRGCCCSALPCF